MRMRMVLALAVAAGPVMAADPDLGARTWRANCAGCHGAGGRGAGPMAEMQGLAVPDLTLLSRRNGGSFPWSYAVQVIDGRSGPGSASGAMPVFGLIFEGDLVEADAPDGSRVTVSARVLAVVDYLEGIQRDRD